jgi:hypothetical protein
LYLSALKVHCDEVGYREIASALLTAQWLAIAATSDVDS